MNGIKELRKKKGWSQAELSKLSGIPFRTIQDWEANKKIPQSYHRIKTLSKLFDCEMDDVMTKAIYPYLHKGMVGKLFMMDAEKSVHVRFINNHYDVLFEKYISIEEANIILASNKEDDTATIDEILAYTE